MEKGLDSERAGSSTHPPRLGLCPLSLLQILRKDTGFGICMLACISHVNSFVKWTKENQSRGVLWGQGEALDIRPCAVNKTALRAQVFFSILCIIFDECSHVAPAKYTSILGTIKHWPPDAATQIRSLIITESSSWSRGRIACGSNLYNIKCYKMLILLLLI